MRRQIILFGDSITEESFSDGGWGAALANHLSRTADVVLRGYSGYNTRWAAKVMDKVFGPFGAAEENVSPLAVTVFFGANDASLLDRGSSFQHVPVDEYKNNLHCIVSYVKKKWPTTLVLLITPPPIDEDGRLKYPFNGDTSGLPERTNESAGSYAKACVDIAAECEVPVVDLWTKMQQFPGWEKAFLSDGLHLTSSGNRVVFDAVVETLGEKGLTLERLPVDLPLWTDIDRSNPLKSFEN